MRLGRRASAVAAVSLVFFAVVPGAPAARADGDQPVQLFTISDPHITESSGLATSWTMPGVVWTVNDSGDKPRVYGLDPAGETVATLTLREAPARDIEAVAVGPKVGGGSWLWVGDIGDNLSSWPTVRVYRAPEPSATCDCDVPWTQYDLQFPDGPRDAEALLVDPATGRLYVVSKRVQGAAVYAAPKELSADHVNVLRNVAKAPPLVTDGSFYLDGRLVIRDYLRAYVSAGVGGDSDRLALPLQPQGESVTWTTGGASVLVGSEGEDSVVWQVPVASAEPSASVAGESNPPSPGSPAPEPPADRESGDSPIVWVVLVAGLVVGGGFGLLARRSGRSRRGA